jgi:endo-1,4-beta-mannosidase
MLRFGVNYVPSRAWWYRWLDWDADAVNKDMQAISELGMDHVRIHCLWPFFQPNAGYVSTTMLDRLNQMLDIAMKHGLDVSAAVLDGWLSGFVFMPSWVGEKNIFTDARTVLAEKALFMALAERIKDHPAFLGFDLGNELGVLQLKGHTATLAESDLWQEEMLKFCEELAPGKLHVNGVDHIHWFADAGFSRQSLANAGSMTSIHAWIEFTGARALFSHTHAGCIELPSYCIELTKAYHDNPGRKVWLQEFGATTRWMPEDDIPDFAESTIRAVATCTNVWGCTWWCSHDIHPGMQGFDLIEYDMGLLDGDNQVKPTGIRLKQIIQEFKANPPTPIARNTALVLPDNTFKISTDKKGWQYVSKYMEYASQGVHPSIVLESRSRDVRYLDSRGITELIH